MAAGFVVMAGIAPLQAVGPGASGPAQATAGPDACGVVLPKDTGGGNWTCSFLDNFGGRALDTNKWITQQTKVTGFRNGKTCYVDSPRNIRIRNGALELVARDEQKVLDCRNPLDDLYTPYTGGMVGTKGNFSQAYGRFEVRAKYPTATTPGVHGGFWMFPQRQTYGVWPASGEIDIAEWWSSTPDLALPSLRYNGSDIAVDSGWGCRTSTPSAYHVYTMEWYPTVISWYIDGTLCFSRSSWTPSSPLSAPQPFDQPFSLILGMGVGGDTGSNKITADTPLPATYQVDYAKVWR